MRTTIWIFSLVKMYCTNLIPLCEPHARHDTGGEGNMISMAIGRLIKLSRQNFYRALICLSKKNSNLSVICQKTFIEHLEMAKRKKSWHVGCMPLLDVSIPHSRHSSRTTLQSPNSTLPQNTIPTSAAVAVPPSPPPPPQIGEASATIHYTSPSLALV
jgi:hypothetical protein